MGNYVFTRARLREIAPELTAAQEDDLIDLYLTATRRFKVCVADMSAEVERMRSTLDRLMGEPSE